MTPHIQPLILGSGNSGQAMARACLLARIADPALTLLDPRFVKRSEPLSEAIGRAAPALPWILIARPHGLHVSAILEAEAGGARTILVEKPAAISLDQIATLESRKPIAEISVAHVYRQMWGPQELRRIVNAGTLGQIFAVEGRYWQSSAATASLGGGKKSGWKNEPALSGGHDTLLDLAPHWLDLASFAADIVPVRARKWLSFSNSESPHRDTHVQLAVDFKGGARAQASISKNVHGEGNHLEVALLGTRASARWSFERPDEIKIGEGPDLRILHRQDTTFGTGLKPFHGAGWIEGYVDIIGQMSRKMLGLTFRPVPTLSEHLAILRCLLEAESES